MKVLVLVRAYPDEHGNRYMMYVHVRNLAYVKEGIEVTVLNFTAKNDYVVDGIPVITSASFKNKIGSIRYDCLISHATNIRNHFRFISNYNKYFDRILFFFHGHEILVHSQDYPEDYSFVKKYGKIEKVAQDFYDKVKLKMLRKLFLNNIKKSEFIFVSPWIEKKFYSNIKIEKRQIADRVFVINNSVGEVFEQQSYNRDAEKNYDYITIREDIDGSKYCVDIINECAWNLPDKKFCLVGTGDYFSFYEKAPNIYRVEKKLSHEEIIPLLNSSKVALMPTREDTQGVMTCEMATFGMPVITSDIEVCRMIFSCYPNVVLSNNDNLPDRLYEITEELINVNYNTEHTKKYLKKDTLYKEIELVQTGKVSTEG